MSSITRPKKDFRHIAASVAVIIAFVALMVLVVSTRDATSRPQLNSETKPRQQSVTTSNGVVSVSGSGAYGNRVYSVKLGGKTVTTIKDAQDVQIYAYLSSYEMGDIILLTTLTGGTAYPAGFRVLEVKSPTEYYLTKEFGDGSDIPTIASDQKSLRVRFPGYYQLNQESEPGFKRPAPTTYLYQSGGKLSLVKATR
jgi:hypothetical protein